MATGANDGTIKLWTLAEDDQGEDLPTSTTFKYGDDNGSHGLESVMPLPDRKRLLVVTQDGTELRELKSGRKLASWPGATGRGALSPDGKLLVTGQHGGTVKLLGKSPRKN